MQPRAPSTCHAPSTCPPIPLFKYSPLPLPSPPQSSLTPSTNRNLHLAPSLSMAERQHPAGHPTESIKPLIQDKGPTATQALSVLTLLPLGGLLLALSGLTLIGTVIGLAVATPVFVLFSPVLVPAAIAIGLAVTGFLASGAFGVTGATSLSWIWRYMTRGRRVPEQMEHMKRRMAETVGHVGQRTKDLGQGIQSRAQEQTRT